MSTPESTAIFTGTYTPGYGRQKALMILAGLFLFALGMWQLYTPLRLLLFGEKIRAEAIDVIKTKPGLPDLVLSSDPQIQANLEPRDRSYIFWNEFSFQTTKGLAVKVRATAGSQLEPLYSLLDSDGLPTTDSIWYDPSQPTAVVFPGIISTWFAPGMLAFVGSLAVMIGSVLLYWANKPIVLPHLPAAGSDPIKNAE